MRLTEELWSVFGAINKPYEEMTLAFKYRVDLHFELHVRIIEVQRSRTEYYSMLLIVLFESLVVCTQIKCRGAPVHIKDLRFRSTVILAAV